MPQSPATYVKICVAVPGAAGATNVAVSFNGTRVSTFTTRPLPNGGLYVCAKVRAGVGGNLTVDAGGEVVFTHVP